MALRINPRLLNESFDYYELEKEDAWASPTYKEPITVEKVRMDQVPNGIIAFTYASDTTPFIKFKRRSKIVTKNGTYTINKVVNINEPFQDKVWSIELELI